MTQARRPRIHRGADGPDLPRRRMVDRFVLLDEQISEAIPPDGPAGDPLAELTEAMLIRLLAKHWGWRRTEPGTLQRVIGR